MDYVCLFLIFFVIGAIWYYKRLYFDINKSISYIYHFFEKDTLTKFCEDVLYNPGLVVQKKEDYKYYLGLPDKDVNILVIMPDTTGQFLSRFVYYLKFDNVNYLTIRKGFDSAYKSYIINPAYYNVCLGIKNDGFSKCYLIISFYGDSNETHISLIEEECNDLPSMDFIDEIHERVQSLIKDWELKNCG